MTRPNFIFIVADDLGYADLGCYGGRDASFGPVSPHLDAMAREGMRFTQGYANSSVCSPTRFALMTGRYQYRLRAAAEEPMRSDPITRATLGLPSEHPTLPSLLRDAGYRTALIGKWHLGFLPHFGPLKSGYQQFFGAMAGGLDYFTHIDSRGNPDLWEGETPQHHDAYLTDLLSKRARQFLENAARTPDEPFLLSLHYTAPHWPWETREDRALAHQLGGQIYHMDGGNIDTYRRMIHHMDEGIGQLMAALKVHGLDENTLVVFTSDNGGERFSDNWPLVGGKMDLTEGGIRVPWIARWPRRVAPGSVTHQHCLSMDWTATVLDAAGVACDPAYPLDGKSMLPVLKNPAACFERPMYWRMNHRSQRALRSGAWKYLRVDEYEYLFDLSSDERERANLAARNPDRLSRMRADWEDWHAGMLPIPAEATISPVYGLANMPQR
jgi:arylsulfatase A-like enzyme